MDDPLHTARDKSQMENIPARKIKSKLRIRTRAAISKEFFGYAEKKWVTFGATQVLMRTPTAKELKRGIQDGKAAAKGLARAITKRRIKHAFKPTTPLFQSDPINPRFVIRTLHQSRCRGTFVDGIFVEVP
jgi:hypothetical protein